MKLMKETRKLTKEQAKWHLENFKSYWDEMDSCDIHDDECCSECMFDSPYLSKCCIFNPVEAHATKHNLTPEQSYAKWRGVLKSIVEGEK